MLRQRRISGLQETRHREGTAVNYAGDHHHVKQGPDRLDAVLLRWPGTALADKGGELLVRVVELVEIIHSLVPRAAPGLFEGRGRGDRAASAEVRVLQVLRE